MACEGSGLFVDSLELREKLERRAWQGLEKVLGLPFACYLPAISLKMDEDDADSKVAQLKRLYKSATES